MTRSIIMLTACATLLAGCHDAKTNEQPGGADAPEPLSLTLSGTQAAPFGNIYCELNLSPDQMRAYDSVLWYANGHAGHFFNLALYLKPPGEGSANAGLRINAMTITDYMPGKHEVRVTGYLQGRAISETSAEFETIAALGDFMCIRWNTPFKEEYYRFTAGQSPVGPYWGNGLTLTREKSDAGQYARMKYLPWFTHRMDPIPETIPAELDKWITATREMFHDCLTELYGPPAWRHEGDPVQTTLQDKYTELFRNPLTFSTHPAGTREYPVEIWQTVTSNICLAWLQNGWYFVTAEPGQ